MSQGGKKPPAKKKRGGGRGVGGNSTRSYVTAPPMPPPRETVRSDALVEHVLERVSNGERPTAIFAPITMPHRSTWSRWCAEDPELGRRYREAVALGADALADETISIADTAQKREEDPRITAQRSRNRQWLAARDNPAKYGERVEHAVGDATGKTLADVLVAARRAREGAAA